MLALQTGLLNIQGYASQEWFQAYNLAYKLCQYVGDTRQRFWTLWGLHACHAIRAEFSEARVLHQQLWDLAQDLNDPDLLIAIYYSQGHNLIQLGNVVKACEYLQRAVELSTPQQRYAQSAIWIVASGYDLVIGCFTWLAIGKCLRGFPEQAMQHMDAAHARAEQLGHPFSMGWVMFFSALISQLLEEPENAGKYAAQAMQLAIEQRFPLWLGGDMIIYGWTLAVQGDTRQGLEHLQKGLEVLRSVGIKIGQPIFLSLFADAYRLTQQPKEGLEVLQQAFTHVETTGECYYAAELHRLRGELLLAQAAHLRQEAQI